MAGRSEEELPQPRVGSNDWKKWDTVSMGLMLVQCAAGVQKHQARPTFLPSPAHTSPHLEWHGFP